MYFRKWVYSLFYVLGYIIPHNFMIILYKTAIPETKLQVQMNNNTIESFPTYIYSTDWMLVMTRDHAKRYDENTIKRKIEELKKEKAILEGDDSEYY